MLSLIPFLGDIVGFITGPMGYLGIAAAAGPAGIAAFVARPAVKLIALGVAILVVVVWIAVLKITVAHRDVTIANQKSTIDIAIDRRQVAEANLRTCQTANAGNTEFVAKLESDHAHQLKVLGERIAELQNQSPKLKIVREKIRERVEVCPAGVDAAAAAYAEWVRELERRR